MDSNRDKVVLGKGSFGVVYSAIDLITKRKMAVKELNDTGYVTIWTMGLKLSDRYIRTCMRVRIRMYVPCMYVYTYVCLYVRMYVCMYVCIYVCMYVCMYVCTYACMYIHMYVCMYVHMYICMYVRMHLLCMYDSVNACMYMCEILHSKSHFSKFLTLKVMCTMFMLMPVSFLIHAQKVIQKHDA